MSDTAAEDMDTEQALAEFDFLMPDSKASRSGASSSHGK